MEIEPFLIASSVEMVIAQRLVRRFVECPSHKNGEKDLLASLSLLEIDTTESEFLNQVRDAKRMSKMPKFRLSRTGWRPRTHENERFDP